MRFRDSQANVRMIGAPAPPGFKGIGAPLRVSHFRQVLERARGYAGQKIVHHILFVLILSLGIFARMWGFRTLPPGLNADEASIGVEAYNLYHYGMDRNGVSYPVHFISWGSGQNALYGYLLIPFVALLGLTPAVVRLPMLITGLISLPLVYFVARKSYDRHFGLLAMFLLAISPWHILLSRWGLESNLFPFVFLAGYACLLKANDAPGWFIPACGLFGFCLYSYGSAYAAVPIFIVLATVILHRHRLVRAGILISGVVVFAILAAPIGLLIAINTLNMNSIMLGPMTIPRLPVPARFEAATVIGANQPLRAAAANVGAAIKLLTTQSDGISSNVVEPYGYFYRVTFPVALLGIGLLVWRAQGARRVEDLLLLAWIGSAFVISIFQEVNVNRFNIMFIPLLLCTALSIQWLDTHFKGALLASVLVLLAAFGAFTISYHGDSYRQQANWKFDAGLLPAVDFARHFGDQPICVSDDINMPYIFAMFSEHTSPQAFLSTVDYVDRQAPLRQVRSYGRYAFGTANCTGNAPYTYVVPTNQIPPRLGKGYGYQFFINYVVYFPRP